MKKKEKDEYPLFNEELVSQGDENQESMLMRPLSVTVESVNDTDLIRKLSAGEHMITALSQDEKKEKPAADDTVLAIDLSSANMELVGTNITAFDISVMDCIYTITKKHGTRVFTVEQIAQVLTGDKKRRYGKDQLNKIRYSVEKLSLTRLVFNPTKELRDGHWIGPFEVEEYRENVITTSGLKIRNPKNGKEILAYELKTRMPLYRYAELCDKIVTYPISMLTMRGQGDSNYSDDIILIGRYLGKEIAKADKMVRIQYEGENGMFRELGFMESAGDDWKSRRKRLRQNVIDTLSDYQDRGIIIEYHEFRDGNEANMRLPYDGVEITVSPNAKTPS